MGVAEKLQTQTAEEYFALEERSEETHDYIMGEIVAMAGGMPNDCRTIDQMVRFDSIGVEVSVEDIYRSVDLSVS